MSIETALRAYRIAAWVTGIGLVILVFVAMPLKYFFGQPQLVAVVGVTHGFLYMIYIVCTLLLAERCRWKPFDALLILLAGTIPLAGFFAERRVTAPGAGRPDPGELPAASAAGPERAADQQAQLGPQLGHGGRAVLPGQPHVVVAVGGLHPQPQPAPVHGQRPHPGLPSVPQRGRQVAGQRVEHLGVRLLQVGQPVALERQNGSGRAAASSTGASAAVPSASEQHGEARVQPDQGGAVAEPQQVRVRVRVGHLDRDPAGRRAIRAAGSGR